MKVVAESDSVKSFDVGQGGLEVDLVFGQSAVTSVWAVNPLKLLVPHPRGPSVWAYLSSFGGGLVAGDSTSLNVRLGKGARCFLSTQASTKVYRSPLGLPCSHQTRATLDAESVLAVIPDPIQAFADSIYVQRQEFRMNSESGLIVLDWLTAGRTACGERWAFTRYQSRNDVYIDNQLVITESLCLEPEKDPALDQHRLGRYNCFALLLFLGKKLGSMAQQAIAAVSNRAVERQAPTLVSCSPLPHGAIVRCAGIDTESVSAEIHSFIRDLPMLIGDDPMSRKT